MKKSLLFGGFLLSTLCSQLSAQCLENYAYRTDISIDNSSNGESLTDYQISLTLNTQDLIALGKMNADGSDLRFGGDCCNLYCHYIESGINTTSTKIWVKVPAITSNSFTGLYAFYGNPTASDASDPNCVFDLYDGFDNMVSFASGTCGSATSGVTNGILDVSWNSDYVLTSTSTFPQGTVYTAEMDVTTASGNWPGLYWFKDSDTRGYGTLLGGTTVRISKSGSSSGYCQGHNWASIDYSAGLATGIWSSTWIATGNIIGDYPGAAMTSTDTEHPRNSDLRVGIGGISGGTGNMSVNWLRVRKYTAIEPPVLISTENVLPTIDLGADITACADEVNLDAGAGFSSYEWNGTPGGQVLNVTSSDYYEVIASDSYGCLFIDGNNVTINDPVVADFSYSATGLSVTFTNTSTNGGASSSWDFGDASSSMDVNPSHTYAASGTYEVCLTETAPNTCDQEYCEEITIGVAELQEINTNYSLYPNPASTIVTVNLFNDQIIDFSITDLHGKVVINGVVKPGANEISIEKLNAGTYFFNVNGEKMVHRFVKQ